MSAYAHGRHEHGQNFLTDPRVVESFCDRVATTSGPIIEIGPGDGALSYPLAHSERSFTCVEIDSRLANKLRRDLPSSATVITEDFLRFRLPEKPHVIVGNIPFHITTAILRRILRAPGWTDAILIMQWEVARRRAGVGASTMMTAQWAPWFEFELGERIPRTAFTPRPNVDGGLLHIRRRHHPLVEKEHRKAFQAMVHKVYTGRGRGLVEIVTRQRILPFRQRAQKWAQQNNVRRNALPSDLNVEQMVSLFAASAVS